MARNVSWDDIPEPSSGNFDVGIAHLFEIESLELTESSGRDGKKIKAMVSATLRCLDPSPGRICYENFTIGDDDKDPEGRDPAQLARNNFFRMLTSMLKNTKLKLEGKSLEQALEKAVGRHVGVIFKNDLDKRTDPPTPRTRPGTFFTEGEMAPGTDVARAGGAKSANSVKPPMAAKPPKAAPPVEDTEEGDEEEAPKPKKPKPAVVEYDEE